jgi:hypothetical protein
MRILPNVDKSIWRRVSKGKVLSEESGKRRVIGEVYEK